RSCNAYGRGKMGKQLWNRMTNRVADGLATMGHRVRLGMTLQSKIILLVSGSMLLILFTSSYLHTVRTRSVVERNHYDGAISQTKVLADRISRYDYFSS